MTSKTNRLAIDDAHEIFNISAEEFQELLISLKWLYNDGRLTPFARDKGYLYAYVTTEQNNCSDIYLDTHKVITVKGLKYLFNKILEEERETAEKELEDIDYIIKEVRCLYCKVSALAERKNNEWGGEGKAVFLFNLVDYVEYILSALKELRKKKINK